MSLPPTHTLEFTGGDTLQFVFQIKDLDLDFPEDPPVPRDLTGWTVLSQVRVNPTSEEVLATWAIIGTLTTDGIIRMKLTPTQTRAFIAPKSVISDVQLTDPDGNEETVLRIAINAAQDVTRE